MKTYLVFGAAGSIGSEVVRQLVAAGHHVFEDVTDEIEDVSDREELECRTGNIYIDQYFDGIIYAVGHCPPGGFAEAVKHPLSRLPLETYQREIGMHQLGVLNVFQCLLPCLQNDGCFVFLSSAITRVKAFPPAMHPHYHASVIAAEDWLIEGMRHDPAVAERKIKIHRLAPAAVDTSFHRNHDGPKPSRLIPISQVVDEILRALESPKHVNKKLL